MEKDHPSRGCRENSASKMRRKYGRDSNDKNSSDIDIDPNKYTARQSSPQPSKKRTYYSYKKGT